MNAEQTQYPIRCNIAKVGLNGHDRGTHVIRLTLCGAGFEVIYSGLHFEQSETAEFCTFHRWNAYIGALLVAIVVGAIVL